MCIGNEKYRSYKRIYWFLKNLFQSLNCIFYINPNKNTRYISCKCYKIYYMCLLVLLIVMPLYSTNDTNLSSLSLQCSCRLYFPIVGINCDSLPHFVFISPITIYIVSYSLIYTLVSFS